MSRVRSKGSMKIQFNVVTRDMKKLNYDCEPATLMQPYLPPGASQVTPDRDDGWSLIDGKSRGSCIVDGYRFNLNMKELVIRYSCCMYSWWKYIYCLRWKFPFVHIDIYSSYIQTNCSKAFFFSNAAIIIEHPNWFRFCFRPFYVTS